MDGGTWQATVHEVAESQTWLTNTSTFTYTYIYIYIYIYVYIIASKSYLYWRRQWHPTPVLLPGTSHGWRSLVGCSPWGRYKSDTTERLHFHFSLSCTGEGNGNLLQCSCLENPRDGGAWWAAVYGVAQSRTRLKQLSSSSSSISILAFFLLTSFGSFKTWVRISWHFYWEVKSMYTLLASEWAYDYIYQWKMAEISLCDFWSWVLKGYATSFLFTRTLSLGSLTITWEVWLPWNHHDGEVLHSGYQLQPSLFTLPYLQRYGDRAIKWFHRPAIQATPGHLSPYSWGPRHSGTENSSRCTQIQCSLCYDTWFVGDLLCGFR